MTSTKRGRVLTGVLTVLLLLVAAAGVVVFIGGRSGVGPLANEKPKGGEGAPPATTSPPPPICPLTGLPPSKGSVPLRPALAVKVENLPAARPQTGLSWADIIYEEPVEAWITRFIVVYQCQDASRIEPVRSARLTDPDILVQYGSPVFAYAGAVPKVIDAVSKTSIVDVNATKIDRIYHRDAARLAPHNLYTSTDELYGAAGVTGGVPRPMFNYSKKWNGGQRISEAHLPFSSYSDVYWRWSESQHVWLRWHGTEPHTYSNGQQVSAKNVVVQVVKVVMTDIHDVNGVASPEVVSVGSGKAYVLRDGKVIEGTWSRPSLGSITRFRDSKGHEIKLTPGNTWVELLPSNILPSFV